MERPIFKPVGTPVMELDTPALVVDLTILEHNIVTLHTFFQQRAAKVRPFVSTHLCPCLAHKQLAAGGTVGGVGVSTLAQAEVFAAHGFSDILVANHIVTPYKIDRLCALARQATIIVAVDNLQNVQDLSAKASTHGATLHVAMDIQTRENRCGIEPGQAALELAEAIQLAPHLDFVGVLSTADPILTADPVALATAWRQQLQPLMDTRVKLEKAGLDVCLVSVGGTTNYEIAGTTEGVTEVQAGTYALMDARYGQYLSTLQPAANVLTTVTSRPEPGVAITDAGQKAIGIDLGLPAVGRIPGVHAVALSAEHCRLQLDAEAEAQVSLGDKIWLTPWDIGTCVNLYDSLYAARQDVLEFVWPIAARGRYR